MLSWLHHSLELDNQLSQAVRAVCKLKEKKIRSFTKRGKKRMNQYKQNTSWKVHICVFLIDMKTNLNEKKIRYKNDLQYFHKSYQLLFVFFLIKTLNLVKPGQLFWNKQYKYHIPVLTLRNCTFFPPSR